MVSLCNTHTIILSNNWWIDIELAIAFTTGLIFISMASLIVAVCIIVKLKKRSSNWRRPIRDHQQANEPYLSTPTVVDVEYDVPIFTNNPAGKVQGNLQEDVHVDKNPAYEQICIYKNIPDQWTHSSSYMYLYSCTNKGVTCVVSYYQHVITMLAI